MVVGYSLAGVVVTRRASPRRQWNHTHRNMKVADILSPFYKLLIKQLGVHASFCYLYLASDVKILRYKEHVLA